MNDSIQNALTYSLIFMIGVLVILVIIFVILKLKERQENNPKKDKKNKLTSKTNNVEVKKEYNKQSIFDFMEFEKIEDNMIIQKSKKKYLMAIECQGINYDLMSGVEKTSVEQGFLQFLNTLRHPIQIYIQTRTVNLVGSISTYKEKLKQIQDKLIKADMDYRSKVNIDSFPTEELNKKRMELIKQRNLYEYGADIIKNTEQMSFNKNILTKKYYIIIPYYPEEIENKDYAEDEIRNLAFSELYTKAQSIISSLYVCGIKGKVLDSTELIELLYVAYNRDDSDMYNLNSLLGAGFEELYSTAPDVLEKRSRELDKKIEEEAKKKANEKVLEAVDETERQKEVRKKEENMNKLIDEMAKMFISDNERYIGEDIANKAKEKIDEESEEKGGKVDDKKEKTKTTTRRTRKTT